MKFVLPFVDLFLDIAVYSFSVVLPKEGTLLRCDACIQTFLENGLWYVLLSSVAVLRIHTRFLRFLDGYPYNLEYFLYFEIMPRATHYFSSALVSHETVSEIITTTRISDNLDCF